MTRNPVSPAVREIVLARAGGFCELRGFDSPEQLHHRRCRGMGSTRRADAHQPANLYAVSARCHSLIESNRELAYRRGWLVRQSHNPAEVPVLRYGSEWALLTDSGEVIPTTEPVESCFDAAERGL